MDENKVIAYVKARYPGRLGGMAIGLIGGLGSGKTTLVKKALELCSTEFNTQVSSPTYNLCNEYSTDHLYVNHFDLYRIESEDELYDIGLWESMDNDRVLTIIEWVDMFPEICNRCNVIIEISIRSADTRVYSLKENKN